MLNPIAFAPEESQLAPGLCSCGWWSGEGFGGDCLCGVGHGKGWPDAQ